MLTIISLGGSIVAPDKPDIPFLREFRRILLDWLESDGDNRAILIVGGGGPARAWQQSLRELLPETRAEDLDWCGIMATRLNAELVRCLFPGECQHPVVTDPFASMDFQGRILVAAGWKPGFSTDFDAVCLAERFGSRRVINLSNIDRVHSADPRTDPSARPLDHITWEEFRRMVGSTWTPGANTPFDPVASTRASELGLEVVCARGNNLENLRAILEMRDFVGTTIS